MCGVALQLPTPPQTSAKALIPISAAKVTQCPDTNSGEIAIVITRAKLAGAELMIYIHIYIYVYFIYIFFSSVC